MFQGVRWYVRSIESILSPHGILWNHTQEKHRAYELYGENPFFSNTCSVEAIFGPYASSEVYHSWPIVLRFAWGLSVWFTRKAVQCPDLLYIVIVIPLTDKIPALAQILHIWFMHIFQFNFYGTWDTIQNSWCRYSAIYIIVILHKSFQTWVLERWMNEGLNKKCVE